MFTQAADGGETRIIAIITGLTAGEHAVKIHAAGDLSSGCDGAGEIYNPFGIDPDAEEYADLDESEIPRMVGDLGTVTPDAEGVARLDLWDSLVDLSGDSSVIDQVFVVYATEAELEAEGADSSTPERLACGSIIYDPTTATS